MNFTKKNQNDGKKIIIRIRFRAEFCCFYFFLKRSDEENTEIKSEIATKKDIQIIQIPTHERDHRNVY